MRVLFELGIDKLKVFFKHSDQTTPGDLAEFLTQNGARATADANVNLPKLAQKISEGKPALVLIENAVGDGHWVKVDQLMDIGRGAYYFLVIDPANGSVGLIKDMDFTRYFTTGKAVFLD